MSVSVKILNKTCDAQIPEYNAVLELKGMLEQSLPPKATGNISILYGLTLCGQSPRDIDILITGNLDNCVFKDYYTNDRSYPKKDLAIKSFCIVVELKEQSSERVCISNTHVYVEYKGGWKDATKQNEDQRYSFLNYFSNACGYPIFVSNFIWLKSLTGGQLHSMMHGNSIGALPCKFTFKEIIDIIIAQNFKPIYIASSKSYCLSVSNQDGNFMSDINKCLKMEMPKPAGLTRRKLEILTQEYVQKNLDKAKIGQYLTIFKGRAGTGKTFRLIQSALSLANPNNGIRCLILTYNHALVSDIRRLLYFMNIPDGIDSYTVQIKTLHSFFMQMMGTLNISTKRIYGSAFTKEYEKSLGELYGYITELMDNSEIDQLKQDNKLFIDWDYILIDEAQDWSDMEKEVLFKVYGPNRILVADGVDQFLRGSKKQNWNKNVDNAVSDERKKGLRQKRKLVDFTNALSEELNLNWKIEPNTDEAMSGGHIIICKEYKKRLHDKLIKRCKDADCENYDMLFLVPPTMVTTDDNNVKHFCKLDSWEECGIRVFDGTNDKNREKYPTDMELCRMYQYESCRGLEGWVTVCFHFDELIDIKLKEAKKMKFDDAIALGSPKNLQRQFVYLWSLIPLTRPIDTLVIQLTDPESEIGKHLKVIADKNPDSVDWLFD